MNCFKHRSIIQWKVHNLLKKLVENATNDEKERLLNSASYFDLRGMLSLTNLAQEASSLAVVHTTNTAGCSACSSLEFNANVLTR